MIRIRTTLLALMVLLLPAAPALAQGGISVNLGNVSLLLGGLLVSNSNPLPVSVAGGISVGSVTTQGGVTTSAPSYANGTTQNLSLDTAGNLRVTLPGGVSISAGSATIGNVGIIGTVPVSGSFWQATQPVSLASSVAVTGTFWQSTQPMSAASLPLPTGAATAANQPTINVDGGAQVHVQNFPGTQAVTGTFWQATQPVSGTVAATQSGTWNVGSITTLPALPAGANTIGNVGVVGTVPVSGTFWQATQPVSNASLPLPSGAATAAKQPALGTAGSSSADVITVQGVTSGTPLLTRGTAGLGTLTAVPSGSTNGTALGTLPATGAGARLYLPTGASVTFTIAATPPAGPPSVTFTVSASTTGPNWDENLFGGQMIYVTAISGSPVFRWF